jgi:hypothetical protein
MIARITLDAHRISLDPALQPRTHTSESLVAEYTDEMRAGAVFPAVVVYEVSEDYLCADGWHRVLAARAAGLEVAAEIRQGTFEDALVCALGANETHGARRTRADKRRAVEIALRDESLSKRSDREIARICAVSHPFVGAVRSELFPTSVEEPEGGNLTTPKPDAEAGLPPQPDHEAAGEVEAPASLPTQQQEEEERIVREKILQAALGCLSHSFHGAAPLGAFRLGVALLFGAELIDEEWDRVVSTGAARGLWTVDGDTIRSHAARPRTVPPVASPIPTRPPISTSGDPLADEEDEETVPAPVAPLKPSKPRPSAMPERLDPSLVDLRCESAEEMLERLSMEGIGADLAIADPPWLYRQSAGASRADDHYDALDMVSIVSHIDRAERIACRLALWITGPLLGEWVAQETSWGSPVTAGAWIKSREDDSGHYGQGYHWAGCVEHVLVYTSGDATTDRSSPLRNGWQEAPGEHSAKPIGWQTQWIRRWVPEGGLVVDLYAGLGSVAHATLLAGGGRRYVGCELDPARHARALDSIEALCAKDGA